MLISIKISINLAFLGSDKPRMLFFLLINVKMPTIVWHFDIYVQEKFHAQLSLVQVLLYSLVLTEYVKRED